MTAKTTVRRISMTIIPPRIFHLMLVLTGPVLMPYLPLRDYIICFINKLSPVLRIVDFLFEEVDEFTEALFGRRRRRRPFIHCFRKNNVADRADLPYKCCFQIVPYCREILKAIGDSAFPHVFTYNGLI